jgi:signal transduction histidine kinase
MNSRLHASPKLRIACQLTGACWAVFVAHEMDAWQLISTYNVPASEQISIRRFLQGEQFLPWIGEVPISQRPKTMVLNKFELVGSSRLYMFPVASMKLILVGVDRVLNSHNHKIWKLTSSVDEAAFVNKTDEEVDLLHKTVLELQLTQQELQALIKAQQEAELGLIQTAKLAAVGEMAAGIAHELNNPLTSVVGFTELVLEELPEDSIFRKDLHIVLQEARRARSVVRSMLDFSRQTETLRTKADLNEIIEDVLMLIRHLMEMNHILLEVHLGENLKWALVDRNQIKQVVINLINNAINALSSGGKIIVETFERLRYGEPGLVLSVRDNGVGISEENLKRIFEPFFTTRGERGGTGLGLSVTFGIVSDHGGSIEVESQENVGSLFEVWLPLESAR